MADNDIEVKLGAKINDLQSGMQQAAAEVKNSAQNMQSSLSGMAEKVASIGSIFGQLGLIVAGGAMFKHVIDKTVEWNSETIKLAKTLGITTEQASVMNVALRETGNSADTVITAQSLLTRHLKSTEYAFTNLGVKTRDSKDNFRNAADVMHDVNKRLLEMGEGFNRNIAGQSVYGRGWEQVSGLLRVTDEVMKKAAEDAKALNLILGSDGKAQTLEYKEALHKTELIMEALQIQIGNQLLPVLTSLGEWFGDIFTTLMEILGVALKIVIERLINLSSVFKLLYEVAKATMNSIIALFVGIATAIGKLLKKDLAGAVSDMKQIPNAMANAWSTAFRNIAKISTKTAEDINKLWGNNGKIVAAAPNGGESTSDEENLSDKGDPRKTAELQIQAERNAALAGVEIEREALRMKKELKEVDAAEELQELLALENKKFLIENKAIEERSKLLHKEQVEERKKLNNELESLEQQHNLKVIQLNNQNTLEIKKRWDEIFNAINGAMTSSVQGIIRGTMTMRQALRNIGLAIVDEFIAFEVKKTTAYLAAQATKTEATAVGEATRTGIEEQGALTSLAIAAGSAIKTIAIYAWEAAAATYKSIAAIPIVGPFLAPAAAVAAAVLVGGYAKRIASAAGGWEVPQDTIAQVHKDEMILPASLSNKIRGMTDPKKSPGYTINYTVNAIDAKGMQGVLEDHAGYIASLMRANTRNFSHS